MSIFMTPPMIFGRPSGAASRDIDGLDVHELPSCPYKTYGDLIVEQKFQPAGFAMPLGLKDIRSLLAAAETHAVPMPVGSLVHDRFVTGIARGGANLDWSALARVAAQDAGL
jgi:3-hydroxyisobutyrate dehydrogenase-like beta-hydroxyacid dehydrogenase